MEKHNNVLLSNIKLIGFTCIYLLTILFTPIMFPNDFTYILKWTTLLTGIGILYFPLISIFFTKFKDKGFPFAKTFGTLLSSIIFFWLSSFKILKFTNFNCLFTTLLFGMIINFLLLFYSKKNNLKSIDISKNNIKNIILEDSIFNIALICFLKMKTYNPAAYGIEKYMDYGFMKSMSLTNYFPVEDFWFSKTNLNYYYYGQYIFTFLTKSSYNKVEYTYNLSLMTISAMILVLVFSIMFNILNYRFKNNKLALSGGIISSIAVSFGSNGHYILFKYVFPFLNKLFSCKIYGVDENYSYWFPNSTRFIGHNPSIDDKCIHEFISYATILGDLHAHVINMIFVLTLLGFIIAIILKDDNKKIDNILQNKKITLKSFANKKIVKLLFEPSIIILSLFLAIFQGTNYWDFPIYFVTCGSLILIVNYKKYGISIVSTMLTIIQGIVSVIISKIIMYPFLSNFIKMESGIKLATQHSNIVQLMILWLIPILCTIIGIKQVFKDHHQSIDYEDETYYKSNKFYYMLKHINITDAIMVAIGCCAMGLVLMPELVYVKDIYGYAYARSNTMFKLTYQAHMMFGLCFGYFIIKLINDTKKKYKIYAIIFLIYVVWSNAYFFTSAYTWFDGFNKSYSTIKATTHLDKEDVYEYDKLMIDYINENINGMPTILEAAGSSYTNYERISVFTGKPTVIGWHTHEWLWKDNKEIVDQRTSDVEKIYTTENYDELLDLIKKYDIDYIYIGKLEYEKYNTINIPLLKEISRIVCYVENPKDETQTTYLLKINKENLNL